MPFNGSGSFSVVNSFSPSATISSSAVNANFTDIASGLSNALTLDGQSAMTGVLKGANGTASAPSYTFASDTNTGFYRIGADSIGLSVNGTLLVTFNSSGITLASGDVIGTAIIPTASIEDNAVTLAKLATQADATVLANVSGGAAVPTAVGYTALFNDAFGSTQGTIIYKGATDWAALGTGTSGQYLKTQGAGANPVWADVDALPTQTGNSGKLLTTDGSSASWSGDSSVRARAAVTNGSSATCTVGTGAVNIASVTQSGGTYTVTFTNALASTNYQVLISLTGTGGFTDVMHSSVTKSVGSFTFVVTRSTTGAASVYSAFDLAVYGGF